jgi:hypothetical protein
MWLHAFISESLLPADSVVVKEQKTVFYFSYNNFQKYALTHFIYKIVYVYNSAV